MPLGRCATAFPVGEGLTVKSHIMLDEPPCPENDFDVAIRLCVSDGKVVAYINPPALASLLWDFWYLAAKLPRGEDISLSNRGDLPDTLEGSNLKHCEITLTGEGPVMGHLHNPIAEFLHREQRVDLFVNRLQAECGYQSLRRLGSSEAGQSIEQVELFNRLILRLIAV